MALLVATLIAFQQPAPPAATPTTARLQVFLDCNDCFADYLREATKFVDFVRDRSEADVHVIITSVGTGSGGRDYERRVLLANHSRPVDLGRGKRVANPRPAFAAQPGSDTRRSPVAIARAAEWI
ncbi:MAG: hypothetical protein H0W53_13285 [Acidobacteria bacterium]|nr:hypothetical protein [Acidobacteriota bacterium]